MKPRTYLGKGVFTLTLLTGLWGFHARATTVQVAVSFDGFNPDPVNIVVGESVFWYDYDGNGPYTITSSTGAWIAFDTDAGLTFTKAGSYPYTDDYDDMGTVNVTTPIPPSVTITSPSNNQVFLAPASFNFAANASDAGGPGLSDVQFYVGQNQVGDVFAAPYAVAVTNLAAGVYALTCIAYDQNSTSATNSISITVAQPPSLAATQVAHQIILSWSTNNAAGLSLKSTVNLGPGAVWSAVTPAATLVGTQWMVTNSISGPRKFYRLSSL